MTLAPSPLLQPVSPVAPSRGLLRPLGLTEVRITGGFWGKRQRINGRNTLEHVLGRLESEGWLPNFDLAATGMSMDARRGREFSDSEVYKFLEAMAWEIGRSRDPDLDRIFRSVVVRVVAAQETDGYLGTRFGRRGQPARWSDLEWGHELYCLGHLFQAAVARARTSPEADDGLLAAAIRAADLVCATFGVDGVPAICGHPEIEVGLAELSRVSGDPRYHDQARLFVERRGHTTLSDIEWGRAYFQDEVPVRETEVLHGHAVRANYLAAGATDVAVEDGDVELLEALRRQWAATTARRTYITGGQGSHHQDEAFGNDWELPPDRAYSETCAGIGSIMFSWRLLLADGDEKYADLIERTLYNVVATSPSDDGRAFYYSNTLHQRVPGVPADPHGTSPRASASLRAPWFEVSCCPPNVARTLASLDAYVATSDAEGVQVHQFAQAEIRTFLPDGQRVAFDMETSYPDSGAVRIRIRADAARPWTLSLRVPSWADGARVRVETADGVDVDESAAAPGAVRVRRAFRDGDVVVLTLPLRAVFRRADPRIDAIRGCVAVERGPEVFALESVDIPGVDLETVTIDERHGVVERDGRLWVRTIQRDLPEQPWPYTDDRALETGRDGQAPLVPYHEWARRGPATMRVWMPRS